jgi:hypothetical protein
MESHFALFYIEFTYSDFYRSSHDFKLVCECSLEEMNAAVIFCGAKILKAFCMKSLVPTRI